MVLTMTGPLVTHETVLKCPACKRVYHSDALLRLVPKWCNVAYDVLVFVGEALFRRYRSIQEVREELQASNVNLSYSEIGYLGRKFISYLAIAHRRAAPRIRESMQTVGGYILHLDATHDGDAPALVTGMDSLSSIVLGNVKVPSEHSKYIIPFLKEMHALYGTPLACVHDMGKGLCKAVDEVFPGVPDFICHFHFLRDIGKDFLESAYRKLRTQLRTHSTSTRFHALVRETGQVLCKQDGMNINLPQILQNADELPGDIEYLANASVYSLSLWVLHGKQCGNGYGFPFDRPLLEFTERIMELNSQSSEMKRCFPAIGKAKSFIKLAKVLADIGDDVQISQSVKELQWRCRIFDQLRDAMRIAMPTGTSGLNDDGTGVSISTIKQAVEKFRKELENDPSLVADKLSDKMAAQIDKYDKKLFADPIEVSTPAGKIMIYPQRTNNILEQFFRGVRRGHRRKTGDNSMRRQLQTMLADTPLVKNLDNQNYQKLLLNGNASLEELFAELDTLPIDFFAEQQGDVNKILPGYRKLMKKLDLPGQFVQLFAKAAQNGKSN